MWNMIKVDNKDDINDDVSVFLLLTMNIFHIFFKCFYCCFEQLVGFTINLYIYQFQILHTIISVDS